METQRCMGCMQVKGAVSVCPSCGYHTQGERNPLVLPQQITLNNKFLIGRVLGKPGGFGITYLAWDTVLHTAVAIKEYLPRELATRSPNGVSIILHSPRDKERFVYGLHQFLQEARTLAQFSHPNVVRAREFFQQNNTAYLVMDYYEGGSLEEFVQKRGGKISEQRAFSIMLPILEGLRQVHEKGFLHRDIKPANIYLAKGDHPILLDFGAARFAVTQKVDRPSLIITEGYAPFEQYLEDADGALGPWTDIYAYGATLYNITTGVTPINAINRYRKDDLLSPIQLIPTLTPQFSRAVMAALTLDHEQRPQNVQALQDLLLSRDPVSDFHRSSLPIPTRETSPAIVVTETHLTATQLIRCPYCRTNNTLTQDQNIENLHCYQCGKKLSPSAIERKLSAIVWILVTVVITLAVMLALKMNKEMLQTDVSMKAPTGRIETEIVTVKTNNEESNTEEKLPEPPPLAIDEAPINNEASEHNELPPSPAPTEFEELRDENKELLSETENAPPLTEESNISPLKHNEDTPHKPPEFAILACKDKQEGEYCEARNGMIQGKCFTIRHQLACIPKERPR